MQVQVVILLGVIEDVDYFKNEKCLNKMARIAVVMCRI